LRCMAYACGMCMETHARTHAHTLITGAVERGRRASHGARARTHTQTHTHTHTRARARAHALIMAGALQRGRRACHQGRSSGGVPVPAVAAAAASAGCTRPRSARVVRQRSTGRHSSPGSSDCGWHRVARWWWGWHRCSLAARRDRARRAEHARCRWRVLLVGVRADRSCSYH
jgi:hypothetical protein